jgi:hypothetical protein
MQPTKTAATKSARFEYDGSILTVTFINDEDIDLEEAHRHIDACSKLVGDVPALVLVDTTQSYASVTAEARRLLSGSGERIIPKIAEAIVLKHLHTRLLARFYIKVDRPPNPIKVFSCPNEAREWLKSL